MTPRYCVTCRHHVILGKSAVSYGDLRCCHPVLIAKSPLALTRRAEHVASVDCYAERADTSWFADCGVKGKLWEEYVA
jgi:hypothetical protein